MLTLDELHGKEMADIVSLLDVIFNEADATGEGRGAVLKALWSEASDRAAFYQDQAKNSETLMIIIPLGFL